MNGPTGLDALVGLAPLLLSGVFVLAAVGKARDVAGTAVSLHGFGFSTRTVRLAVIGLPMVEILVAVGLWIAALRRPAAIVAGGLLVTFSLVVGRALRRGTRVRCACFGSTIGGDAVISRSTLVRNVLLLGMAALVAAVDPPLGALTDAVHDAPLAWGTGLAVALLGLTLTVTVRRQLDLLQRYGAALERISELERIAGPHDVVPAASHAGLDAGSPAPAVMVTDVDGSALDLSDLWAAAGPADAPSPDSPQSGEGALLVFSDPSCAACRLLVPELADLADSRSRLDVAIITAVTARRSQQAHPDSRLRWLVDRAGDAFDAFDVARTPTAVLVDGDGRLVAPAATGTPAIRDLLRIAGAPTLTLGDYGLVASDGAATPVRELLPSGGSLIFWNNECSFCQALLPMLAAVPADVARSRTLLVLTGGPDRLDTAPPGWPTVVDPIGLASDLAGVPGTPAVVPIDGDGVAGTPTLGADAVQRVIATLGYAEQLQP